MSKFFGKPWVGHVLILSSFFHKYYCASENALKLDISDNLRLILYSSYRLLGKRLKCNVYNHRHVWWSHEMNGERKWDIMHTK